MTHPTINGHQKNITLKTATGRNKGLMGIVPDGLGGFWSGSFTYGEKNHPGLIYHSPKSGPLVPVELPYPLSHPQGPDAPSPQASELLLHENSLFISDNTYGTVYRYDTKAGGKQASIFAEFSPGPVFNQAQGMVVVGSSLWVAELHQCYLYEYDLKDGHKKATIDMALVTGVKRPLQGTPNITLSTLIATPHDAHSYLWIVIVNNEDPSLSMLARIDATTPADVKTWTVSEAKASAFDSARHALYISSPSFLYAKDITTDEMPSQSIPLDNISSPYYMAVDAAGYVWIADYNSDGHIYEIDPAGGIVAEYALNRGTEPATPAHILWIPPETGDQDALVVVDNAENGRLIFLSPPDGIDQHGVSSLQVSADPQTQTVHPGDVFTTTIRVLKGGVATEAPVSLLLLRNSPDVAATDPRHPDLISGERSTVPVAGLPLRMTAGAKPGKINVRAYLRGGSVSSVFTGTIEFAVTSIDFSDKTAYSTRSMEIFDKTTEENVHIIVTPPGVENIKVTLNNGGTFIHNNKNTIVVPLDSYGKALLPMLRAGKPAGDLTITATAGKQSKALTWHVTAKPVVIIGPENGTINHTRLRELSQLRWTVLGYKEEDTPTSGRTGVPGASLQLSLLSANAHFVTPGGTKSDLVIQTDKDGVATLSSVGASVEGRLSGSGEIVIRAEVVRDIHGDITHLPIIHYVLKIKVI